MDSFCSRLLIRVLSVSVRVSGGVGFLGLAGGAGMTVIGATVASLYACDAWIDSIVIAVFVLASVDVVKSASVMKSRVYMALPYHRSELSKGGECNEGVT